ncbi:hypothetical protein J2S47_002075 [Streptomyces griseoviridis]|uniref:Uncharacterized protein n=1 Tax=Streptomyces griseoviridis TaxID=45398 RepID=A0ABT9LCX2_STRGD|nr:hypothetical protein [Streptomyces griseoviridis]
MPAAACGTACGSGSGAGIRVPALSVSPTSRSTAAVPEL